MSYKMGRIIMKENKKIKWKKSLSINELFFTQE